MREGLRGGQLNFLSGSDLDRIHDGSLRLLEDCGLRCSSAALRKVFAEGGAEMDPAGERVRIPPRLVEWAVGSAPQSFLLQGRDPAFDLLVEQPRVYYGMGGTPVPYFWDFRQQILRSAVEDDMVSCTRVGHALPNVDFVMCLASAGDAPQELHYLYEYNAILRNSTKPAIHSAPGRQYAGMLLQMAAAASGSESEFRQRPSVMLMTQPVSPLEIGSYNEGMIDFAAWGAPILFSPGVMMGATGPATLAGALVQGNAENLAGVVLSQLLKPGTPVVYGVHTPVLDMRTLRCTYAGAEQSLGRAAMAQLARYYGLPSFNTGAGCDAKVVDGQAAAEATMGIFLNALSGLTLTQTMGTMAGGTFGSLEMLVLCDEIVGMAKRILRGVEVSDEKLAVDLIRTIGPGGHFLDQEHTLRHFREEFFFPRLFDRRGIPQWEAEGGKRIDEVARARVREILSQPAPQLLSSSAERALNQTFKKLIREGPALLGP